MCLSRPQYSKACGITSVVSCFNFLYSWLGAGSMKPLTVETAMTHLGFKPPYEEIKFGSFTGNGKILKWFRKLVQIYGMRGQSKMFLKLKGKVKGPRVTANKALTQMQEGLRGDDKAYIYHSFNHYFLIIGYERMPDQANQAYEKNANISKFEEWVIIGEISKKYPCFHVRKWEDVV